MTAKVKAAIQAAEAGISVVIKSIIVLSILVSSYRRIRRMLSLSSRTQCLQTLG